MTKAIFEKTKLNNNSIQKVQYATSKGYRSIVKNIDNQRLERLNNIKIITDNTSLIQKMKSL